MERKDQLVVSLSHGDRFGQYRVTARCGSAEYMDFFNPANELRRKVFAENTISKFNWEGTAEHLNAVNAVVLEELRRIEKDQLESEEVKLRRISGLQGDALTWLWPGRIAVGKLCVIAGDPGLGKSLLTLDVAARLTSGKEWPDGAGVAPITDVALLNAEDGFVDTVRPRLEAAGADLDRIFAITGVGAPGDKTKDERGFDLSTDVAKLGDQLRTLRAPRLLIIDPVSSYLGSVSENANAEIRNLLKPLAEMADETKTGVILVTHLRKAAGSNLHRVIGSIAFAALARSGYVVMRVKEGGVRARKLVPIKLNLQETHTALLFLVRKQEATGQPVIVWESVVPHDEIELPTSDVGRPPLLTAEDLTMVDAALADGPKTAAELYPLVANSGISKRSFYEAVKHRYRWLEKGSDQKRRLTLRTDQPLCGKSQSDFPHEVETG